jgi:hydrogenase maturation protease
VSSAALVIGVGNRHRGDDAAGLALVDRLEARASSQLRLRALTGAPVELSRHWSPEDAVVIVDAARAGGGPPGEIYRFDALEGPLPAGVFAVSTHSLGVSQGIELARALAQLPRRLVVYGVEGRCFERGAPLSAEVSAALEDLAAQLESDPFALPARERRGA